MFQECKLVIIEFRLAIHNECLICFRHAFNPLLVSVDRAVKPNGMLLENIADGSHRALWHLRNADRLPIEPVLPFPPPFTEPRPQILQPLK